MAQSYDNKKIVRVTVDIKPNLQFKKIEKYPRIGIQPVFEEDKLIQFIVTIKVPYLFSKSDMEKEINNQIKPLIMRLQYLTKFPLKTTCRLFEQIDPPLDIKTGLLKVNTSYSVHKPIDMLLETDVIKQNSNVTKQISYYIKFLATDDVIDRIKK